MLDIIVNLIVCALVATPVAMTLYLTFFGE